MLRIPLDTDLYFETIDYSYDPGCLDNGRTRLGESLTVHFGTVNYGDEVVAIMRDASPGAFANRVAQMYEPELILAARAEAEDTGGGYDETIEANQGSSLFETLGQILKPAGA